MVKNIRTKIFLLATQRSCIWLTFYVKQSLFKWINFESWSSTDTVTQLCRRTICFSEVKDEAVCLGTSDAWCEDPLQQRTLTVLHCSHQEKTGLWDAEDPCSGDLFILEGNCSHKNQSVTRRHGVLLLWYMWPPGEATPETESVKVGHWQILWNKFI